MIDDNDAFEKVRSIYSMIGGIHLDQSGKRIVNDIDTLEAEALDGIPDESGIDAGRRLSTAIKHLASIARTYLVTQNPEEQARLSDEAKRIWPHIRDSLSPSEPT